MPVSLFPVNHEWLDKLYRTYGTKLIHAIYKPTYRGFDKLPPKGPAIIVCNHVSYVDGLLIAAASKRKIRFVIYEKIYDLPVIHHFMRINHAIPIFPTRSKVERAMNEISDALKAGHVVCIFPEGQMTYTGGLSRFKPGIEFIIRRDAVPVYPVALTGLWGSVFSRKYRGSWKRYLLRRRQPVVAICGDPMPPEEVTVNLLQEVVLKLKYQAQMEPNG